jgi:hypothetical protein
MTPKSASLVNLSNEAHCVRLGPKINVNGDMCPLYERNAEPIRIQYLVKRPLLPRVFAYSVKLLRLLPVRAFPANRSLRLVSMRVAKLTHSATVARPRQLDGRRPPRHLHPLLYCGPKMRRYDLGRLGDYPHAAVVPSSRGAVQRRTSGSATVGARGPLVPKSGAISEPSAATCTFPLAMLTFECAAASRTSVNVRRLTHA